MEKKLTSSKILNDVNEIINKKNLNVFDALVHFCEKNNYEPESVAKLIPSTLLVKVENEAKKLKLLKKEYTKTCSLYD